jgi:hypothetical protein
MSYSGYSPTHCNQIIQFSLCPFWLIKADLKILITPFLGSKCVSIVRYVCHPGKETLLLT